MDKTPQRLQDLNVDPVRRVERLFPKLRKVGILCPIGVTSIRSRVADASRTITAARVPGGSRRLALDAPSPKPVTSDVASVRRSSVDPDRVAIRQAHTLTGTCPRRLPLPSAFDAPRPERSVFESWWPCTQCEPIVITCRLGSLEVVRNGILRSVSGTSPLQPFARSGSINAESRSGSKISLVASYPHGIPRG